MKKKSTREKAPIKFAWTHKAHFSNASVSGTPPMIREKSDGHVEKSVENTKCVFFCQISSIR